MSRIWLQQDGDPCLQDGFWKLRWREDAVDADNLVACLSPAMGSPRVTAAEPERSAWENRSRLDRSAMAPQSVVPIADFVENVFVPEHVAMKGLSGRTHYQAILKHVLTPEEVVRVFHVDAGKSKTRLKAVPNWPYLGGVRLCDVRPDDIQRLISAALAQGYSTQTVKHIRNVVSAIFAHARKKLWFNGDNPASLVTLPEMTRKEPHALTLAQANELLGVMQYPEKEMTILAILTSMNIAEICGLQWKHVNLTESWSHTDGKPIPPKTIAVRKEWYRGELSRVQQKSRNRDLSIPEPLLSILSGLSRRPRFTGPEDFVLVSNAGTPVNEKNIAARRLKSIGKDLQMPWLSWHALRRTHATLAYELGMQFMKTGLSGGSSTTHEEGLGGRLTMSGS